MPAPTTATISTTAAPVVATAAIALSTTATTWFRACFIHDDFAAHKFLAIERFGRATGFLIVWHFDEAKTAELSRHLIAN
jgi:hypothetical protein